MMSYVELVDVLWRST